MRTTGKGEGNGGVRDVQEASVNDTRCCTLVGNINNTHKHTTGQGVSAKVAVRTA